MSKKLNLIPIFKSHQTKVKSTLWVWLNGLELAKHIEFPLAKLLQFILPVNTKVLTEKHLDKPRDQHLFKLKHLDK